MASTGNPHDFVLTPQQQSLLFAALNSNKQPVPGSMNMSPASFGNSPNQKTDLNVFDTSPFLDYDYDINADTSFDFSFGDASNVKMIGDLPETAGSEKSGSENNETEKRSHPEDENEEEGGDAKRQETGEKVSKKPGRKPLTTEPTSVSLAPHNANINPCPAPVPVLTALNFIEAQGAEQGCAARIPRTQRTAPQEP
jgi:AP-1-like transcription factor